MPSTEYFGNLITNLGPLTTTFTAAASCETQDLALADTRYDTPLLWRSECDFPSVNAKCMPSASEHWDLYQSYRSGRLTHVGWAPYHSPASICPSGWETVGIASLGPSDSMSKSGIFTESMRPTPDDTLDLGAFPLAIPQWYMGALEEGEQVVWCCPSNHTVDIYGVCLSAVGPWDAKQYKQFTTICNYGALNTDYVTVTSFDGTTWDPPLLSMEDGLEDEEYTTFKETPTATSSDYAVVHSMVVVALINKPGDENDKVDTDNDGEGDNGSGSNDDNDNNGNGDDDDSAPSIRALTLVPFTVVGLGFLAGMGVLMPW